MGVPIIDALKDKLADGWSMLDAPPGSSCSVVATAIDTDFAILVTEPTPFGVHDLDMATQVIKKLGVPGAIVINRSVGDDRLIEDYAATNGIPVIGRLPFSLGAAQAIARGELLVQLPKWRARFEELGNRVRELVG
jgi:MinD superfamily P-loop ATPase